MAQDQQRLSPTERANLVAYLDGELGEKEAQLLSTKLTLSATARREAEALERTWELLDHLPRTQPSERLAERTLTEARKIEAAGGLLETAVARQLRIALRTALWLAAVCVGFVVGYLITNWVWPNPTARLMRDASIAEHLEEYRDVGSFEFLKALADTPEFSTEREE